MLATCRTALFLFALVVLCPAARASERGDEFIEASELVPGEEGFGLTVLRGDSIIRFPVTFIGRLENALVQQDMILIRLVGEPYDKSGIIQGMSGSPIYFRNRLLGALAYGWQFAKEPIAGVTPIKLMLRLLSEQAVPQPPPPGMIPLAAPLSVAGLPPDHTGEAWRRIDALGFLAASGGRAFGHATLEPGSAVGVRLVDGDVSLTAIGTVTYVRDSDVIAFGHPFLNRGLSYLPMTGARIETILPATNISFKLGSATEDVGAIRRDGATGISGSVGAVPSMIPMDVAIDAPWGSPRYHFRICRDDAITQQLFDVAWAMAAEAGAYTAGPAGVEVDVTLSVAGRAVTLKDRGVVERSILDMMPTVPLKILYDNPFMRIHPDSVSIRVAFNDDRRSHEIIALKPLVAVAAPGDEVPLDVVIRSYDAGRGVRRVMLKIPESFPEGTLTLSAGGGRGLSRSDLAEPADIDALLDRLEAYEASNTLVVTGSGAVGRNLEIERGMLPSLPPSVRKIQSGIDRGAPTFTQTEAMDAPVFGKAGAQIDIRRPQ